MWHESCGKSWAVRRHQRAVVPRGASLPTLKWKPEPFYLLSLEDTLSFSQSQHIWKHQGGVEWWVQSGKAVLCSRDASLPRLYYGRETTEDVLELFLWTNKPVGCVGINSTTLCWCLNLGCASLLDRLNECLNKATSKKEFNEVWLCLEKFVSLSLSSMQLSPQGHQMKRDLQNYVIVLLILLRIKEKTPCVCTSSKPCWHYIIHHPHLFGKNKIAHSLLMEIATCNILCCAGDLKIPASGKS